MSSEQVHRELAAREARLRAILDAEPECVKLLAADGTLLEMNPAGLRMIEADSFQQVDHQCLYPLVAEEHRTAFRELTARVFRGQSGTLEFHITGLKGTPRWLETHASPLRNAAGAIVALVGITRDVTGRRNMEAALRENERLLTESQRIARIGSWFLDVSGRVTCSPETYRLFGVSSDTFPSTVESCINLIHPGDRATVQAWIGACEAGEKPRELKFRAVLPDGTVRFLSAHGEPRYDAANRFSHMTGTVQDVTASTQAETALRTRARQQETAARLAQRAITASLPSLFDEVTAVVADTLDVELCKVLELLPGGAALRLVAGVGWRPGLVGQETVPASMDSQAGFTLASDAPVIVEDLRTEARFQGPALLTEHGVVSGMSVPIRDAHRAYGVIGVHTRERRRFTADDAHFLETVAGVLGGAIQRGATEVALRESEARLSGILKTLPDGIVLINMAGEVLFANPVAQRRSGLAPGRGYDESTATITTVDGRTLTEEQRPLNLVLSTGRPVRDFEQDVESPNGTRRILSINAAPMHDADGTVIGAVGTAIDITSRKLAETALRTSEQRYERLLESAPDATVLFDRTGRVIRANAHAVRLFGYPREEFLALTAEDLMPSRFRDIHARHVNGYVAAPHARRMGEGPELWALRKDGSEFPCEISLNYDRDRDDVITVAAVRDVSERRRVEVELRQAQSRLDLAARMGGVGLWDRDLRTQVCWRSPEWKAQIGYTDDEIGTTFDEFTSRVHPADLPLVLEREQLYLSGVLPTYEVEFRFRHKNGSHRQILTRGATLPGADGAPARLMGAHIDITEVRQLEAQFRQAQKMESVGRLAGGIAHDFNNLLTVINGVADLALADVTPDDPLHSDLRDIQNAGERAASLTHQLLAFSRRQILKPEVVSLNPIIEGIESLLRRLIGEHIELVFLPGADLGNIKADRGQIEQVILNLVVNARDAMPTGGRLTIETRAVAFDSAYAATHPSVQPGPHVLLAISDTGTGIDEAIIEHVFEPFFTTKGAALGTGLGLATVYGIVRQSGGSIEVESEIDQGTTFTIYLPCVCETTTASPVAPAIARARGTETILLVEDEPAVRALAGRVLTSAGYLVLTATGGEEALHQLTAYHGTVHLLLTDVIMPGMNGRELAERVAVLSPATRVLYTSGYTDDAILRVGVLEDAAHFIAKPYTPDGLARQVREVLDQV